MNKREQKVKIISRAYDDRGARCISDALILTYSAILKREATFGTEKGGKVGIQEKSDYSDSKFLTDLVKKHKRRIKAGHFIVGCVTYQTHITIVFYCRTPLSFRNHHSKSVEFEPNSHRFQFFLWCLSQIQLSAEGCLY